MKQTIWTYFVGLVMVVAAFVALIMTLGVLTTFGMQVYSWPLLVFMALILYRIIPKASGTLVLSVAIIIACAYFEIMLLSRFCYQPMYYLMMIVLAISSVLVMLKGKPWWMWLVIFLVFLVIGIDLLFDNDTSLLQVLLGGCSSEYDCMVSRYYFSFNTTCLYPVCKI